MNPATQLSLVGSFAIAFMLAALSWTLTGSLATINEPTAGPFMQYLAIFVVALIIGGVLFKLSDGKVKQLAHENVKPHPIAKLIRFFVMFAFVIANAFMQTPSDKLADHLAPSQATDTATNPATNP